MPEKLKNFAIVIAYLWFISTVSGWVTWKYYDFQVQKIEAGKVGSFDEVELRRYEHALLTSTGRRETALTWGSVSSLSLISYPIVIVCVYVVVNGAVKTRQSAPGGWHRLASGWRWLARTRDKLGIPQRIILAVGVSAVLICLPFMVNLGRRDPASDHPGVWFLVILLIAGFQWFIWGTKKPPEPATTPDP